MSMPSSATSPPWRVLSIRSFMRLSVRRKVDLPQPEGPISASTERSGTSSDTSKSDCLSPYQKLSLRMRNFGGDIVRAVGLRPDRLRSEMIAEYDSVDMKTSPDRRQRSEGMLLRECVESVKIR